MTETSRTTSAPATAADAALDFAALGLPAPLVRAAAAAGWRTPSAVQAAALPAVLAGRDVLVQAPTGAGKTGAFLLPLLAQLMADPATAEARPRRLHALVLAPTRDLAVQTAAAAMALAPHFKTVAAVGGLSINPQMMALRGGANLLVATPGRLLDLTRQNAVRLNEVAVLVLDEADRLLEPAFADETRRVLALLPRQRQTLLFSATMPEAVHGLAAAVQRDALLLQAAADDAVAEPPNAPAAEATDAERGSDAGADAGAVVLPATLRQRALVVDTPRRAALLRHLLQAEGWTRTLVFVATQHACEHVAGKLARAGVAATAFHAQLSPGRRSEALQGLQSGRFQVVVATDVAARGLDLPGLQAVVNFDLPRSPADHVHRVGRAARAGAAGTAVSFVLADAPGSERHFRLIEKRQGQRVPREVVPGFEPALPESAAAAMPAPANDGTGGVKGLRPSRKDKLRAAAARSAAARGPTSP
jgi:superfamily II DNA/RNA helicase